MELVPKVVWADGNRFERTCCVRRDEFHGGNTPVLRDSKVVISS